MGVVIDFPVAQRLSACDARNEADAAGTVIILPVIRIERYPDEPSDGLESGARASARKRRRRASRS